MTYISLSVLGITAFKVGHIFEIKKKFSSHKFVGAVGGVVSAVLFVTLFGYGVSNGFSENALTLLGFSAGGVGLALGLQKLLSIKIGETLLSSGIGYIINFGHSLDGITSAYSITFLDYFEKKPVSSWVMETAGNAFYFYGFKVAFVLGVLYFLREEELGVFEYLVLLGVAAAGIGPGIRNLSRVALGI